MEPTKTPEHEIRRPGYKSSEFALTAVTPFLVMALIAIARRFNLNINPEELATLIITVGGAVATYIHSRGRVKVSRNEASAAAHKAPENVNAGGDVNMGQGQSFVAPPGASQPSGETRMNPLDGTGETFDATHAG